MRLKTVTEIADEARQPSNIPEIDRLRQLLTDALVCALYNESVLREIKTILQPLAQNRRFMQLAGPARQCINKINHTLKAWS
jgi:hypothetical protein